MRKIYLGVLALASFALATAQNVSNGYNPKDNVVKLYGPGGPHTALIKAAKEYEKETGNKVEVNFGPESTWTAKAQKDADIIFNASEQAMTAFLENYKFMNSADVEPLYMHRAVLAVKKGNPKGIKSFQDLLTKDVKIVVTEGKGTYNTSGTGLWEDVAGRLGKLSDMKNIRSKIVAFEQGSGAGFKAFQRPDVDVWITWADWSLNHTDVADLVEIGKDRVIYRDLNVVASKQADPQTKEFIKFLKENKKAQAIFKAEGWMN